MTTTDAERADLLAELAEARSALTRTAHGLTDEQAGLTPTTSALCIGGLIKHVASTEDHWIRFVLDGPAAIDHSLPEGVTWEDIANGTAREYPEWMTRHHEEFRMAPGDTLAGVLARYDEVAARTAEVVATIPDLSRTQPLPAAPWNEPGAVRSVRRVLVHIIAETTQHAGHADILRESIDGQKSS